MKYNPKEFTLNCEELGFTGTKLKDGNKLWIMNILQKIA